MNFFVCFDKNYIILAKLLLLSFCELWLPYEEETAHAMNPTTMLIANTQTHPTKQKK
jgi:hypothetical protein